MSIRHPQLPDGRTVFIANRIRSRWTSDAISNAAHEYLGLEAYWLMGYISSPWPR